MNFLYVDWRWIPQGLHMDFISSPPELHLQSIRYPYGVQMDTAWIEIELNKFVFADTVYAQLSKQN
jgi:hypothetical protein